MNPLLSHSGNRNQQNQNGNAMPNNLMGMLQTLGGQVNSMGMNPEQLVRNIMKQRNMGQAEFEQYAQIANSWMSALNGGRR